MDKNWKEFVSEKRREIVFVGAGGLAVLLILAFIGVIYEGGAPVVPEDFARSRAAALDISFNIAELSNDITQSYTEIAAANEAGNYEEALNIIDENSAKIRTARGDLMTLLDDFERMLATVGGVKPRAAADVGEKAITSGVQMIEELLYYYELNDRLAEAVRQRVDGTGDESSVASVIAEINAQVRVVNAHSQQYQNLIRQFDSMTGQGN